MFDVITVPIDYESLRRVVVMSTTSRDTCSNDVSQRVAKIIRAAFPDSLPYPERGFGRNGFIIKNRWKIFDENHDGRLSLDEYLAAEWAGYLAFASDGACVVTEYEYMDRFLGKRTDKINGWAFPGEEQMFRRRYRNLDRNNRGYITKDDIIPEVRAAFMYADKDKKGYIVPDDLR